MSMPGSWERHLQKDVRMLYRYSNTAVCRVAVCRCQHLCSLTSCSSFSSSSCFSFVRRETVASMLGNSCILFKDVPPNFLIHLLIVSRIWQIGRKKHGCLARGRLRRRERRCQLGGRIPELAPLSPGCKISPVTGSRFPMSFLFERGCCLALSQ